MLPRLCGRRAGLVVVKEFQPSRLFHSPAQLWAAPQTGLKPRIYPRLYPKATSHSVPTLEQVIKQALNEYHPAIVLTQVGSFYESYFDQAKVVSRLLNLKLTSKSFNKQRVSACGFLTNQLDKHIPTLIDQANTVVILNEYRLPQTGQIERRVSRILSPGTALEHVTNNGDEANYLVALGYNNQSELGLVYKDLSTGVSYSKRTTIDKVRDELLLIRPCEVVYDQHRIPTDNPLIQILQNEQQRQQFTLSTLPPNHNNLSTQSDTTDPVRMAEELFECYVDRTLGDSQPRIGQTESQDDQSRMILDPMTIKSLELRQSSRGTSTGSLVHLVKRTLTPAGARLLSHRICSPSTDLSEVQSWLDGVSGLSELKFSSDYLGSVMAKWPDLSKLVQRLTSNKLNQNTANDLLAVKQLLIDAQQAKEFIIDEVETVTTHEIELAVRGMVQQIDVPTSLVDAIEHAIDEEALTAQQAEQERKQDILAQLGQTALDKEEQVAVNDGTSATRWGNSINSVIRHSFDPILERAHTQLEQLRVSASQLEQQLRDEFESPHLSLRDVIKHGPIVHVLRKNGTFKLDGDPRMTKVQTKVVSASTRTYHFDLWTSLHQSIEDQVDLIRSLERDSLLKLVDHLRREYDTLQRTADGLAQLDLTLSFARLSKELNLVKPVVNETASLSILNGRHLAVERALSQTGRQFTTNSVKMDSGTSFVHCLTGPNMAGKSTFLRQNAIIVILAQAGSFVPAQSCELGIVDRVFSRVGARDELDRNKSSFMIEAEEAACILNEASDRSLVLLDELGRGTSPIDGISVAFATLEHIVTVNKSRTLFATHYHKLGELIPHRDHAGVGEWRGLEFWCTDVREDKDSVVYSRTVRRGLNDDSSGLIIARLAGIPERAVKIATRMKQRLEFGAGEESGGPGGP